MIKCGPYRTFINRIFGALIAFVLSLAASAGCLETAESGGPSASLGELLDTLTPTSPTTSDNNNNEPTGGDADPSNPDASSAGTEQAKVLELVNTNRAAGADCGSAGSFESAGPLAFDDLLNGIAQAHSNDMSERGYFDHTNPDGDGPGERIDAAGYSWSTWGENIASGHRTPEAVVEGWMNSDGHCSNIMNPAFTEIGIGFEPTGYYWTQVFGKPR